VRRFRWIASDDAAQLRRLDAACFVPRVLFGHSDFLRRQFRPVSRIKGGLPHIREIQDLSRQTLQANCEASMWGHS
jgi:hypothetical protein